MDESLYCADCGDGVSPDEKGAILCSYCKEVISQLCAELDWYRANHGDFPTELYKEAGRVKISWEN